MRNKDEKGFTYIELIISLSIVSVILPVIFFCFTEFQYKFRDIIDDYKLRANYISFFNFSNNELKLAGKSIFINNVLEFELESKIWIKYEIKKNELIRTIKKPGDNNYRGYTVLMQHIRDISFCTDPKGLAMVVNLQKGRMKLVVVEYFSKRGNFQ